VTGNSSIGGLVGVNADSVIRCHSSGTVVGGEYVGGLVGKNLGSITASHSAGTVRGNGKVGSLAGDSSGSITASYSTASVVGGEAVGGLTGGNSGSITTSYSTATVIGHETVGGLAGYTRGSIAASYSTGIVIGNRSVGGFVGSGAPSCVTNCFWDVETSGQRKSVGGTGLSTAQMQDINIFLREGWDLVDESGNGTCDYWQISSGNHPQLAYAVGRSPVMPKGLGTAEEPYLIQDARDLGTVWFEPSAHYHLETSVDLSGITWSMGVVPSFNGNFDGKGHMISNLRIEGGGYLGTFGQLGSGAEISNLGLEEVDLNGTHYVGGLAGYNSGSITRSGSTGVLTGTAGYVGGLAGYNSGSITASYSTGAVSGKTRAGGLVGASSGRISVSYSTGGVTGDSRIGGLVGENCRNGAITASYSAGTVSGNSDVGGLAGYNWGDARITSSLWDAEVSGVANSAGGAGWPTAVMRTAVPFLIAGWDFVDEAENGTDDVWWILEGQDYPRLWWELPKSPEN
jgi:hypothetical protein